MKKEINNSFPSFVYPRLMSSLCNEIKLSKPFPRLCTASSVISEQVLWTNQSITSGKILFTKYWDQISSSLQVPSKLGSGPAFQRHLFHNCYQQLEIFKRFFYYVKSKARLFKEGRAWKACPRLCTSFWGTFLYELFTRVRVRKFLWATGNWDWLIREKP